MKFDFDSVADKLKAVAKAASQKDPFVYLDDYYSVRDALFNWAKDNGWKYSRDFDYPDGSVFTGCADDYYQFDGLVLTDAMVGVDRRYVKLKDLSTKQYANFAMKKF